MKKLILGLVAATAVAVAAPGLASADVSTNGTTNDAYGYCHGQPHRTTSTATTHGIGQLRSEPDRRADQRRRRTTAPRPSTASTPRVDFAPISNNG